jgi:hypothetical protein
VYDPYRLQTAKVTLHKERPVIDIGMSPRCRSQTGLANYLGRWTTYLFEFKRQTGVDALYDNMKQVLRDFNIEIVTVPTFRKVPPEAADLWSLIDSGLSNPGSGELQHLECPCHLKLDISWKSASLVDMSTNTTSTSRLSRSLQKLQPRIPQKRDIFLNTLLAKRNTFMIQCRFFKTWRLLDIPQRRRFLTTVLILARRQLHQVQFISAPQQLRQRIECFDTTLGRTKMAVFFACSSQMSCLRFVDLPLPSHLG